MHTQPLFLWSSTTCTHSFCYSPIESYFIRGFFQLLSKVVQDFISPKRTWDKRGRGDCLSSKMSMSKQVTHGKELSYFLSYPELSYPYAVQVQ